MGRVNDMTTESDYKDKPIKTRIQFHLNFMVMLLNAGRVDMAEDSLAKANALIEGAIITEGEGQ
jgi:hypothetical protein